MEDKIKHNTARELHSSLPVNVLNWDSLESTNFLLDVIAVALIEISEKISKTGE